MANITGFLDGGDEEDGVEKNSTSSPKTKTKKKQGGGCTLCHKKMMMFKLRSVQCGSCMNRFCSKCCPKDNRGNLTDDDGEIIKKNVRFCLTCKPMNLVYM